MEKTRTIACTQQIYKKMFINVRITLKNIYTEYSSYRPSIWVIYLFICSISLFTGQPEEEEINIITKSI